MTTAQLGNPREAWGMGAKRRDARRRMRRAVAMITVAALVPLVVAVSAETAGAATATITSTGPLTAVGISDQLNCSVNHSGDTSGEFFSNTACGTFAGVD